MLEVRGDPVGTGARRRPRADAAGLERELAAHIAVAEALATWDDVEGGCVGIVAGLVDALACQAGVLWVPGGDVLEPRVFWYAGADVRVFRMMTLTSRLRLGAELPGLAWQDSAPRALGGSMRDSPRWRAAAAAGMNGAVAVPAVCDGDLLAVVELVARQAVELDGRLKRSLTAIGFVLGEFLNHRRGLLAGGLITDRQVEVLQLAAEGLSARRIAERLTVSTGTVRTHLENIYPRLGARDKASAVAEALRLGLIT